MKTGKALITGGAGCIGSELAERLAREGKQVVIFDNFSTGKDEHLSGLKNNPLVKIVNGDIQDLQALKESMKGLDTVFHLAANSSTKYNKGDPTDKDLKINIVGTYNVLEAMRFSGVENIVFTSSQTVYGEGLHEFDENSSLNPISFYGSSKAACEHTIQAFCNIFGMRCWIFRFANVVTGKTRKSGTSVIPDFINKLKENNAELEVLGDGKQAKSYLHVDDCIDAMLFCMNKSKDKINIFNIGTGDTITVDEIAEIIMNEMKLNAKILHTGGERGWPGDVPVTHLSIKKIRSLGWSPRYRSPEAVRKAVKESLNYAS